MKNWRLFFVILIGFALSSCGVTENEPCEECEECTVCEVCIECPVNPFPEGLVLPQIYIQGRIFWTNSDLVSLQENVIDPIVAYFEAEGHTVVSISVTSPDLSASVINTIIVEVIVSDNDNDQDPLSMGVLIEKVGGVFPVWEQESIGP